MDNLNDVEQDIFVIDKHRARLVGTVEAVRIVFGKERLGVIWKDSTHGSVADSVMSQFRVTRPTIVIANADAFDSYDSPLEDRRIYGFFAEVLDKRLDTGLVLNTCLPYGKVQHSIETISSTYGREIFYLHNPVPHKSTLESIRQVKDCAIKGLTAFRKSRELSSIV